MRKNFLTLGIALCALLVMTTASAAEAAGNATVKFTSANRLEYENVKTSGDAVDLGDTFKGVAPGETRSHTITVKNENDRTSDFYMSTEAVKSLEKGTEKAKGAGYDIKLTAGSKVLYDSTLGGYVGDKASESGIEGMNELLEDYILIATLSKGQSTDVVLTIHFDGEAMDNNSKIDYTETFGQINFDFKVGYEDPTETIETVTVVTEKKAPTVVTLVQTVTTGDNALIGAGILVAAAGAVLFIIGARRKKAEANK